ncbi:hypothetical protein DCO45_19605 [Comamonas sp. JNW]|nr:hypothetical protein DCO45_19605 [Comamonas sp. JNW]
MPKKTLDQQMRTFQMTYLKDGEQKARCILATGIGAAYDRAFDYLERIGCLRGGCTVYLA